MWLKITKITLQINEHEISFHIKTILDFKFYSLSLQLENKVKLSTQLSWKFRKFDRGTIEMFTSEYKKEESLWNVMSGI